VRGLSDRERRLILGAVAVALLVGVPGLLLDNPSPGGRKPLSLAQETKKRDEVRAELARTRREIEEMETLRDARLYSGTPRELVARMVRAAQEAANRSELRVKDLKPLPVENAAGLQRVPVRVSLTAPFAPAARFLYELERDGGRYRVDQVQMTATDLESDRLEVELRMVGYVKGEEEGNDAGGS
jgi:type II secretory pathway component PulM